MSYRNRRMVAVLQGLAVATAVAACGGSGSGTSYWQQHFAGGTTLDMSLQSDGTNVSGWAQYGDGQFQHFTGTKNSDGTYQVSAYTGRTLTIDGDTMTGSSYHGTDHWTKISESEFASDGGPVNSD